MSLRQLAGNILLIIAGLGPLVLLGVVAYRSGDINPFLKGFGIAAGFLALYVFAFWVKFG